MRTFIFILAFAGTCCCVHAQSFSIKSDFVYASPHLWKVTGEAPNSHFNYSYRWAPSVGAEYQFPSGFIIAASAGYQKDQFSMNELRFEYQPLLIFQKTYTSVALNVGGGYSYPFGSTNFSAFGLASVGAGFIQSEQVTNSYDMDGQAYVQGPDGSFTDTVQIHYSLTDQEVNAVKLKFEFSAGVHYQWKHLFCRVYGGVQVWASPFSEIQYHTYHSSEHYNMERTSDGDFGIKPGYLSYGVGFGWKFGDS